MLQDEITLTRSRVPASAALVVTDEVVIVGLMLQAS